MEAYSHYLYGRHFLLRTDHAPLRWLMGRKDPRDQQARWVQRLSDFQFTIEHQSGKESGDAHAPGKCFRGGDCFHPGTDHPASRVGPGTHFSREELKQVYWSDWELEPAPTPYGRAEAGDAAAGQGSLDSTD